MPLIISDETLQAAKVTDNQLRLEIAVMLYASNKLTLGQASEFCGMPQFQFQNVLGERKIPMHYDVEDFEQDMRTLESLRAS